MPKPSTASKLFRELAFALGGLGGSNAHGAGFLQAARDLEVRPATISCTSGMILWVAHYLAGDDLPQLMQQAVAASNPLPAPWQDLNSLWVTAAGLPGIFRPAWPEYWLRWLLPPNTLSTKTLSDRLLPAQLWVPTRPPKYFDFVAETLNASEVGVVFNSFDPQKGVEHLFINDAYRRRAGVSYGARGDGGVVYDAITPQAAEGALWLFDYGYERRFDGEHLIDGAYHRQFILDELCAGGRDAKPEKLYVVRPQNFRWLGRLPENQFEQQDMQTEMFMNASYEVQISRIELINRLLAEGKLQGDYRQIALHVLEIDMQRGFFEYFVEKQIVFDDARRRGAALLASTRLRAAA